MKKRRETMDELDVRLLAVLSEDPTQSYAQVKSKVGVSIGTVYLRVNRLKEWGVIRRAQLILDPKKLGYDLAVIVRTHVPDVEYAVKALEAHPRISKVYVLTGETNLMAYVYLRNAGELQEVLQFFRQQLKADRSEVQIVLDEPIHRGVPLPTPSTPAPHTEATRTNGSSATKKRKAPREAASSSKKK